MKKALLIITILVIILGAFLYFRNKNAPTNPDGTKSGFKSFFNFGSKDSTTTETPGDETSSEFTPGGGETNPDGTPNGGEAGGGTTTSPSIFGTSGPFTPSTGVSGGGTGAGSGTGTGTIGAGGGVGSGGGVGAGGGIGGGSTGSGGGIGGGGSGGGGTGGGGGGGTTTQCTLDDTSIEFTPEEIARLRALEERFYALAPALRTDADVQAELANYGSYKLLNQKYAEMITYCENKSPLLPNSLNRRVATPLYVDASATAFFSDGPDADGVIDMQSPVIKFKEIEQFFRISIW